MFCAQGVIHNIVTLLKKQPVASGTDSQGNGVLHVSSHWEAHSDAEMTAVGLLAGVKRVPRSIHARMQQHLWGEPQKCSPHRPHQSSEEQICSFPSSHAVRLALNAQRNRLQGSAASLCLLLRRLNGWHILVIPGKAPLLNAAPIWIAGACASFVCTFTAAPGFFLGLL